MREELRFRLGQIGPHGRVGVAPRPGRIIGKSPSPTPAPEGCVAKTEVLTVRVEKDGGQDLGHHEDIGHGRLGVSWEAEVSVYDILHALEVSQELLTMSEADGLSVLSA